MRARELKKHLKRLNAPRHWMLDKLGGAFICCFPELSFGFLTSPMLLHFNFVFIVFVNASAKAIVWTPQVEGMFSTYSHSAKQNKVCFDIQRSDFYSYAKACYGRCGKGAHGFMRTHKWRDSIGAFINVEASGTGGLDLVCKSGPGSWPSSVYAQSAIYPMAHSAAQGRELTIAEKMNYLVFMINAFKVLQLYIITDGGWRIRSKGKHQLW